MVAFFLTASPKTCVFLKQDFRRDNDMGISLIFILLSLWLHALCLWRARSSTLQNHFFLQKQAPFYGTRDEFMELLDQWVLNTPNLQWHQKSDFNFVVEEVTSFMSYGLFYAFRLDPEDKGFLVHIGVEAKLIPLLSDKTSALPLEDLKDVS